MNGYSIPKATLGRLPQYLQYLKSLPESSGNTISATAIAKGLSLGVAGLELVAIWKILIGFQAGILRCR